MAAKKTEEMTKEVRNEETTEEVKAEAKPEEKPDDWVNVYLMRDSDKYKGDVFVQVTGVGYIIQRGKNVKVPKAVAAELPGTGLQNSGAHRPGNGKIRKWFEDADLNRTGCARKHASCFEKGGRDDND